MQGQKTVVCITSSGIKQRIQRGKWFAGNEQILKKEIIQGNCANCLFKISQLIDRSRIKLSGKLQPVLGRTNESIAG